MNLAPLLHDIPKKSRSTPPLYEKKSLTMGYTKEQIERIEFWIKMIFYYVEYPEPVQEYWWKDREGKWMSMYDMGLDHLKASARRVQKDVDKFMSSSSKKDKNYPVFEKALLMPAKKKQQELEKVLREKVLS